MTHDELHTAIRLIGWRGMLNQLTVKELQELTEVTTTAQSLCTLETTAPSVAELRLWLERAHEKYIELINRRPEL